MYADGAAALLFAENPNRRLSWCVRRANARRRRDGGVRGEAEREGSADINVGFASRGRARVFGQADGRGGKMIPLCNRVRDGARKGTKTLSTCNTPTSDMNRRGGDRSAGGLRTARVCRTAETASAARLTRRPPSRRAWRPTFAGRRDRDRRSRIAKRHRVDSCARGGRRRCLRTVNRARNETERRAWYSFRRPYGISLNFSTRKLWKSMFGSHTWTVLVTFLWWLISCTGGWNSTWKTIYYSVFHFIFTFTELTHTHTFKLSFT